MPPRNEVTEARPTASTARQRTVPPIAQWISPPVVVLIDHAPTNPSLRTLLRNELDIVLPRVDTPSTTEAITAWLNAKFFETTAYTVKLKPYYDSGQSIPSLFNADDEADEDGDRPEPARTGAPTLDQILHGAQPAQPAATQYPVDPDGSFIMRGIHMAGVEHGRAQFEATIIYTGDIRIPADVVRGGRDAVIEFLRHNRDDLSVSTETYLYPEEGFVSERVVMSSVTLNEEHLRVALAQIAAPAGATGAVPTNPGPVATMRAR